MIAITTRSSIRVKPGRRDDRALDRFGGQGSTLSVG